MKISELEKWLTDTKKEHGDIDVCWESISHTFPVDPDVRGEGDRKKVIVN